MNEKRTLALVAKSMDFGESDKIITFFTSEFGKLPAIAKGAKKSKKRFFGSLELFSLVDLLFSGKEESNLVMVNQIDLRHPYRKIREDLKNFAYASFFLELILEFTAERQKVSPVFHLLVNLLDYLEKKDFDEKDFIIFQLKFLSPLGYEPNFQFCSGCKRKLIEERSYFSPPDGSSVCLRCISRHPFILPLSVEALKVLQKSKEIPLEETGSLFLSSKGIIECKEIISYFIQYLLNKRLKSEGFLYKVLEM